MKPRYPTTVHKEHPFDGISSNSRDPYKELYCAILAQAFKDLNANLNVIKKYESQYTHNEAYNWFFPQDGMVYEGFLDVCDAANMNPAYIRKIALELVTKKIKLRKVIQSIQAKRMN